MSLLTNMRSKNEGWILGQGLRSNLFYCLHINYPIVVLFFPLDWLYTLFKKWGELSVGWNIWRVKCPWGEIYGGWNVRGVKYMEGEMSVGWNLRGVMCLRGEISLGWNVLGWNVFGVKYPDEINHPWLFFTWNLPMTWWARVTGKRWIFFIFWPVHNIVVRHIVVWTVLVFMQQ